ncbi:MAG: DNA recombination protein RmuC [Bacteroidia bacterium]
MEILLYILVVLLAVGAISLFFLFQQARLKEKSLQNRLDEITQHNHTLQNQYAQLQSTYQEAQQTLSAYQEKFNLQEKVLAEAKQHLTELQQQNTLLHADKARNEKALETLQNQLENQKNEIETLHQQLKKEFELLSAKLLEQNTQKLQEQNRQALTPLISPVQEYLKQLKEVEAKIQKYYDNENKERASLKTVVETLTQTFTQKSTELTQTTEKLTKALTTQVKEQGIWGEMILEKVLELSGLEKDREYKTQFQSGDKRPDVIIHLPDNRHIIIDAKVTLTSLLPYHNAQNDEEKQKYASDIIQSIERHYKELSQRDYEKIHGIHSPDFVLMFVPIESLIHIIDKYKPQLYNDALRRKIILVTPTSLLVALRTIYTLWQQNKRQKEIEEILRSIEDLYDKIKVFTRHFHDVGSALQKAQNKFEEAEKALSTGRGNAMSIIEKRLRPYINPKEKIEHFLPVDEEKN